MLKNIIMEIEKEKIPEINEIKLTLANLDVII